MSQLFLNVDQKEPPKADFFKKRKCFQKEIRGQDIQKKIKQLRIIGNDGPHIKSMVNALPLSWEDLVEYMMKNQQYSEAITKIIIDKVYHVQLSESAETGQDSTYFLLPENPPQTSIEVEKVIYFFYSLLQYQGIYAPQIFKRYLIILLDQSKTVNKLHSIFQLFILILKKPQLNWAPIQQIVETIKVVQKTENQKQLLIFPSELETYLYLAKNSYQLIETTKQIKERIISILEKGPECLDEPNPKLFFKLCLNLTYYENLEDSGNNEKLANFDDLSKKQKRLGVQFHDAMIKGGIFRSLYRQIFFSKQEKLRRLCLQVLRNLIVECGGRFLWMQQKYTPISNFQHQIKNTQNSMILFKLHCEVFLISILHLSRHELPTVFKNENEIDTLELILYILETVDKSSFGGKEIHEYAEGSLRFMLQDGTKEIQQNVRNKILQSRWKFVLGPDSQLVYECQKMQSFQS